MPSLGTSDRRGGVSGYLGAFFLVTAGINIGLVVADRTIYRAFGDQGLFSFVRSGWRDVVMDLPGVWIGLLAAGEIAIGLAFLARPPWPRVAYLAAGAFHLALMLFGWGVYALSPDRGGAAGPARRRPGARSRPRR
jgi:hypothetical protein